MSGDIASQRVSEEPDPNVANSDIDWQTLSFPLYANVHVRPSLDRHTVIRSMRSEWSDGQGEVDLERFQVEVFTSPFRVCIVEDFLYDDDFVEDLVREIPALKLEEKAKDLFKLKQSPDLSNIEFPEVKTLLRFLKGECRSWLQRVTGIQLSERVDATFSLYSGGDYLLCHDDQCENRKIAFILYCNKNYTPSNGGALALYDTDENGDPKDIVETIYPGYNKFVFFEVSHRSFHRVQDVGCVDRISVNGWFYARDPIVSLRLIRIPPPAPDVEYFTPSQLDRYVFNATVNKIYMRENIKNQLKAHFELHSESMLHDFVITWISFSAARDLDSASGWVRQGPLQRRCYDILPHSELEGLPRLHKILDVFKSAHMFDLIAQLTGIPRLAAAENPRCTFEIQRWTGGYYSLASDHESLPAGYALEAVLFIAGGLEGDGCGDMVYFDAVDGAHLLTVSPVPNGLGLTYRDSHVNRFVRYVSPIFNSHKYYMLIFTYLENDVENNV